ncbi:YggT family protein [Rhodococcus antarcticus]|uniref:YggT family protein n=1 Tax=Rhodococcus antarcticus TaxID=2987751 RepID=A0ABY6NVV0_9NOCA|nr:YggT family protein [Rhodococcus antarcticus]UZJ23519.1 YggT family protein [Rhodococcus antarcticus]
MYIFLNVAYLVLFVFWLLLISRIVTETVRSFARDWRPSGAVAVGLEAVFTVTDPPVRGLRKIIPSVPIGGARLDVSIMVLLLVVYILMFSVQRAVLVS